MPTRQRRRNSYLPTLHPGQRSGRSRPRASRWIHGLPALVPSGTAAVPLVTPTPSSHGQVATPGTVLVPTGPTSEDACIVRGVRDRAPGDGVRERRFRQRPPGTSCPQTREGACPHLREAAPAPRRAGPAPVPRLPPPGPRAAPGAAPGLAPRLPPPGASRRAWRSRTAPVPRLPWVALAYWPIRRGLWGGPCGHTYREQPQ
jgi:hypothetical protein